MESIYFKPFVYGTLIMMPIDIWWQKSLWALMAHGSWLMGPELVTGKSQSRMPREKSILLVLGNRCQFVSSWVFSKQTRNDFNSKTKSLFLRSILSHAHIPFTCHQRNNIC